MKELEMLYEGRAKQVFATDDENLIIMHYKDDATAFNGIKKAKIQDKGILNNEICSILYEKLNEVGIPTHFVKKLEDRDQLCKKVQIYPLEIIVRNIVAGSMAKRLDIPEGTIIHNTIYEINYKSVKLNDPLINKDHAVALGLASYEELDVMFELTSRINETLKAFFKEAGITLVDFKLEFGKTNDGMILLADEFSPDTCRLWDSESGKKLDKDRFRRDLGKVIEAYNDILARLERITK